MLLHYKIFILEDVLTLLHLLLSNLVLPPKMFWVDANSSQAMVKMTTTGHGFDNNINAAEFKPIDYSVFVDGFINSYSV